MKKHLKNRHSPTYQKFRRTTERATLRTVVAMFAIIVLFILVQQV